MRVPKILHSVSQKKKKKNELHRVRRCRKETGFGSLGKAAERGPLGTEKLGDRGTRRCYRAGGAEY